jgi:predicted glycosyltransferase
VLFHAAVDFLAMHRRVKMVILPRTVKQEEQIRRTWPQLFNRGKILIPKHVVDGLNLIWYSDLVISGGGTMNREAAALGVPVYSTFRGKIGGVDQYLANQGRLVLLTRPDEIPEKVRLVRRNATSHVSKGPQIVLNCVIDHISDILESQANRK